MRRCSGARQTARIVVYPEEGHGFAKSENAVDFLKRIERFLAKHNPAD